MLYIVRYLDQYRVAIMNRKEFKDDSQYSAFLQTYDLLETALDPMQLSDLHPQRAPALFSWEQFIKLMTLFAESSGGFILKQDATSMFGARAS
ncbi:hypothetical protein BC937DRAFT_87675 [Endogone sp. FLAS-F59071]|nr:hypothetical protein BC937DRAFT_87675 [Endogone sp. FLAS-F59071]|eukprot:RUS19318.1 hypothetical protein BC937DRAFT_87675 [Endogone sp. FLAS-F59071]